MYTILHDESIVIGVYGTQPAHYLQSQNMWYFRNLVKHADIIGSLFQRPCISRRVTVQEQIAAYMDSPLDAHFFGPELTPPGRLHRSRAYHHHRHHSPPDLEEEVSCTSLFFLSLV